jgi:hypothetical protein
MPRSAIAPAESRLEHPRAESVQRLLELVAAAQQRECELEAVYTEGHASARQLAELEQVRALIEDYQLKLDGMGYYNLS